MKTSKQPGRDFPIDAIKETLSIDTCSLASLEGGTNERTFLASTKRGDVVVRLEKAGGLQLRRAYHAQQKAMMVGVSVPKVLAHNFDQSRDDLWIIEEKVDGAPFYPDQLPYDQAMTAVTDLGRQFKLIHSVQCDRFGLLPPYPYGSYGEWATDDPKQAKISEELTGPVFQHFQDYLAYKKRKINQALTILGIDQNRSDEIMTIYSLLDYDDAPRFCGGDTATSNILVADGRVQALIDWEWANGSDPAENIASWSYWNDDTSYLDILLDAYQPHNPTDFRKRVVRYEVVYALTLAHVYTDIGETSGIEQTKRVLERKLREKRWE